MRKIERIELPKDFENTKSLFVKLLDSLDSISNKYEELKKNNPDLSLDEILKLLNNNEQEAKNRI